MSLRDDSKPDTILTHAGRNPHANFGVVNPPVYHASTIVFPTVEAMEDAQKKRFFAMTYGRHGTPTTFALEEAVARLEGGWRAIAVPSGLAAIVGAITGFVRSGDHVLVTDNVYGPTRKFCDETLARFGVETTYYDPLIGAGIAQLFRPQTRLVYTEAPGSLSFEMQDIPAIAAAAHKAGLKVLMDNTWATPMFCKPFKLGVDVVAHAATKYIVGHSDAMLGIIDCTEESYLTVRNAVAQLGYSVGPDDIYLGLRGLRTMGARLRQHQITATKLANWLKTRPEVERVLYPALPEDPGHALWKRDMTGASGLFGVVLKPFSKKALAAMLDGLELYGMGASWGGFESLILPAHIETVRTATRWTAAGPTVRIHAGLEDPDDLIKDLERGFERLRGTN
ncbi:MAG: cystathionine beta-lyase [Alphaproteobacteria bacterium]|nr:cystathionine beta-lyase [Alphaproteobacteria bacterium]